MSGSDNTTSPPSRGWPDYEAVSKLFYDGDAAAALVQLESLEKAPGGYGNLVAPFVTLRARVRERLDDAPGARRDLLALVEQGVADQWTFEALARFAAQDRDAAAAARFNRQRHAVLQWPQSEQHGYDFPVDHISHNIPLWRDLFIRTLPEGAVRALDIGSGQGLLACWLLDNVIGPRGGHVTCVDEFSPEPALAPLIAEDGRSLLALFDENIRRTGRGDLCRRVVAGPGEFVPAPDMVLECVHLSGVYGAAVLLAELTLGWALLAPGGLLIVEDARSDLGPPGRRNSDATPLFLAAAGDRADLVRDRNPLILRRVA